jgi:cytochrome d ubiquinol oxidase subunit I
MDLDPLLLSRIQFAFVVSFHIIFPAFTIGLAAWLATIEGMRLTTGNPVYRRVFDFWIKVFALSFGMGVVSGIVMAFQFGTNWSVLAERTGPIQGPLLGYVKRPSIRTTRCGSSTRCIRRCFIAWTWCRWSSRRSRNSRR